ncbi:PEP-CTERM system histidine kinase PrsK [Geomonas sp. Red32]|uniref:XrtA/PEP-CTERM system histidine kinase PrsK n=1 Tax=Geomonas sp. Red32 TaxID=2912856 RepID=UPI00202CC84D|nr:XrtA/PEP-CTERM system histidine kinase PrsK [Geomonas sp. Red32]MCM0083394.1 PEP-CTERM system histidine kinase PrsK [Geomonas sp. Red32]
MTISLIAVAMLSLSVLRLVLQPQRRGSRWLLVATLAAAALLELGDLCAVTGTDSGGSCRHSVLFIEAVTPALWLLLSLSYGREGGVKGVGRGGWLLFAVSGLLLLVPVVLTPQELFYAPDFPAERILFLTDRGYLFYVAILVFLVAALMNFESTLLHASPDALWRVKLDIVALGSMLAVLVFYYSNALLQRTLNMELVPLRALLFMLGAGLVLYSRAERRGAVKIRVSQRILLRSAALAAVVGYLVLLGALGEGLRYFGDQFPRVLTMALGFISGMLLLLVLLSNRLKREVKVFFHKNFYQSKYDYRTQWLAITERLATAGSGENLLKRILSAYCEIFGVRGAAIYLHQEECGWFCATGILDLEGAEESLADNNPLLAYLRGKRWVFYSGDDNPEILAANRSFIDRHRISFVIPLFEGEALIGFIALGERMVPDERYRYEDFDLMKAIGRQVSISIQQQRLSEQLTQARAMEAAGSLATFVIHDLKNLTSTVSLIVDNAGDHIDNPDFQRDMLESLGRTSQKMQDLIGRLSNLEEMEYYRLRPVDLLALVERSASLLQAPIAIRGDRHTAMADEEELQKVLLNLFLNGIEASERGAQITAEVGHDGAPYIKVIDRGCGMSPRFIRSELFTPFRSTKLKGLGIGMYQCRQIVAAHGGRLEVSSVEGVGTEFTVWLPPLELDAAGVMVHAA